MRKLYFTLFALTTFVSAFIIQGCDDFNSYPLNIPLEIPVTVAGNTNNASNTSTYCMTQSEDYQDNRDKLKDVKFVEASFRTESIKANNAEADNLTGTIGVSLSANGTVIFSQTLNNIKPSTFKNTPYRFTLTEAQMQMINQYLDDMGNTCFTTEVSLVITSGDAAPYQLKGYVDLLLEGDLEF